ncbi:hypothetical protein OG936_32600 [Streptomyces sp. NBC_00846]|nr:hypothetical protein OG936_32600 [Streptomyces sp. NBC_00846]
MRRLLGRRDDLVGVAKRREDLYDAIANRDVPRVEEPVMKHLETGRSATAAHLPGSNE